MVKWSEKSVNFYLIQVGNAYTLTGGQTQAEIPGRLEPKDLWPIFNSTWSNHERNNMKQQIPRCLASCLAAYFFSVHNSHVSLVVPRSRPQPTSCFHRNRAWEIPAARVASLRCSMEARAMPLAWKRGNNMRMPRHAPRKYFESCIM